jgi:hypothetical protein
MFSALTSASLPGVGSILSNAGNSNYSITLNQAALGYLALGFSVIPIHTDPERAKAAAVPWKLYQQRQATQAELSRWFRRYTGLGIVTGAVSRLLVLDFDDPHGYQRFRRAYPDLSRTYTVRTRRGWHLYYRLPAGFNLRSRQGQGIDLKAEGGLVVAPPTVIAGHAYTLSQAVPPQHLSETDIASILAFFAWSGPDVPEPGAKGQEGAFSCEIGGMGKACPQPQKQFLTAADLQFLYDLLAARGSRNEALFRVSRRARDAGWTQAAVVAALAEVHVRRPANGPHRPETPQQRYAEALRTIASAFSRPPGRFTSGNQTYDPVPNAVREALFQLQQTYTVRVLDGLRLAGVEPGQSFTTSQALKLLAGQVGKHSVYHALKATTDAGQALFPPSGHPPETSYADTSLVNDQTKECSLVGPKNREKPPGGRPERVFIMPTNLELCRKLQVKLTRSDPLTQDDLVSAKQTRMAAHREFIKRRPGMYSRRWLARRLGVCRVTLDSYNREIPIQVRHCYADKPIFWDNLHEIPLALDIAGTFLEDERGKRYPAKREIARRLLAGKHTVTYRQQGVNFYGYGALAPQAYLPVNKPAPPSFQPLFAPFQRPPEAFQSRKPEPVWIQSKAAAPAWIQSTQPTGDVAALAARVYREVNQLADPSQRISQANARKLVETYGAGAVEKGLQRLRWYAQKGRVEKPAGFLVTASRVAWHGGNPTIGQARLYRN